MEEKEKLAKILIDIKAEQKRFAEVEDEQKQTNYDGLLKSFDDSIDRLVNYIDGLDKKDGNKIPSKNELESIEMMLDIINKIDYTTLDKLNRFGGKAKS